MLNDFDNAFVDKVKGWFSNTLYANTALVYNVAFNLVNDSALSLKFPLISIYRPEGFNLADNQSFAARRRGIEYYYDDAQGKSSLARFLVANLAYQLDLYAKTPESLNTLVEDIMQALNFYPTLTVEQKDEKTGESFSERYDIEYMGGPTEQSEFSNDDRVYRYVLVYRISNARLVNFRTHSSVKDIDLDVELKEND